MCFSSKHHEQVTVGPGETFNYECVLSLKKPGPFEAKIAIFLEDNGIRIVELTVRGVAVASEGVPHDSPPKSKP